MNRQGQVHGAVAMVEGGHHLLIGEDTLICRGYVEAVGSIALALTYFSGQVGSRKLMYGQIQDHDAVATIGSHQVLMIETGGVGIETVLSIGGTLTDMSHDRVAELGSHREVQDHRAVATIRRLQVGRVRSRRVQRLSIEHIGGGGADGGVNGCGLHGIHLQHQRCRAVTTLCIQRVLGQHVVASRGDSRVKTVVLILFTCADIVLIGGGACRVDRQDQGNQAVTAMGRELIQDDSVGTFLRIYSILSIILIEGALAGHILNSHRLIDWIDGDLNLASWALAGGCLVIVADKIAAGGGHITRIERGGRSQQHGTRLVIIPTEGSIRGGGYIVVQLEGGLATVLSSEGSRSVRDDVHRGRHHLAATATSCIAIVGLHIVGGGTLYIRRIGGAGIQHVGGGIIGIPAIGQCVVGRIHSHGDGSSATTLDIGHCRLGRNLIDSRRHRHSGTFTTRLAIVGRDVIGSRLRLVGSIVRTFSQIARGCFIRIPTTYCSIGAEGGIQGHIAGTTATSVCHGRHQRLLIDRHRQGDDAVATLMVVDDDGLHTCAGDLRTCKRVRKLIATDCQLLLAGRGMTNRHVCRHDTITISGRGQCLSIYATLRVGLAIPGPAVTFRDFYILVFHRVNGQMQCHHTVAAIHGLERSGVVSGSVEELLIPLILGTSGDIGFGLIDGVDDCDCLGGDADTLRHIIDIHRIEGGGFRHRSGHGLSCGNQIRQGSILIPFGGDTALVSGCKCGITSPANRGARKYWSGRQRVHRHLHSRGRTDTLGVQIIVGGLIQGGDMDDGGRVGVALIQVLASGAIPTNRATLGGCSRQDHTTLLAHIGRRFHHRRSGHLMDGHHQLLQRTLTTILIGGFHKEGCGGCHLLSGGAQQCCLIGSKPCQSIVRGSGQVHSRRTTIG